MDAVRLYAPKDLRFETIDKAPAPGTGEVRIKVAYAGICGSDIHNFKTGAWISRSPSTAGHEFSGWVDAVGDDVGSLKPGDKVAADSRYYCGKCRNCLAGNEHLCETLGFVGEATDGGFAEYVTLPARLAVRGEPQARLDVLALAEPLAVALHALNRTGLGDTDPLLVVGCGPIGALVALASDVQSERKILVCDIDETRSATVASAANATAIALDAFDQHDNPAGEPVSYVIDTTGSVAVISHLLSKLSGATLGLVGIGSGTLDFDPVVAVEKEISIAGCHAFKDELPLAIQMLERHADRFDAFIEHRITLEETPVEFAKIVAGQAIGIKTLIEICPG